MPFDFNDASRSAQRAKRRKTNIILNTLIAIVVILILIVGGSIFFGGSKTDQELADKQTSKESAEQAGKEQVVPENTEKDNPVVDETSKEEENTEESNDQLIEKETGEPNVEKVIINQGWKPVGTEQVGNHQRSSSKGTVDWNEQVKAASYAVDIPVDNMTVWWLEGGENREKQAIATVAPRNNADEAYRVYIEWVDGEGWKPTEVKKLTHNDKR
ncbi:YrrS family protein [Lederbergia citrea]|uniref:YrrS family protein n=1 Tax=Lederbergia citrea TaxID=2833581 RepID=UPI001BC9CF24|nr:YrrS family protein [Lederbergia citrea]MBS4176253.1 YrrS family protein [Lederbergia citrea]MBS4202813.1 YrrS family protein [Lederbergia citrea]